MIQQACLGLVQRKQSNQYSLYIAILIMKRFLTVLPAAGHVCRMGWDQIWKDLQSKKLMSNHYLPILDQLHIKQHVQNKHPKQQETELFYKIKNNETGRTHKYDFADFRKQIHSEEDEP